MCVSPASLICCQPSIVIKGTSTNITKPWQLGTWPTRTHTITHTHTHTHTQSEQIKGSFALYVLMFTLPYMSPASSL